MLVPEVGRQFEDAGVEQVGVFQYLVVEVVLRLQPERPRLDAHVDVFRHQNDFALRVQALQVNHHGEDLVVGLGSGQPGWQVARDGLGLQEEAAAGLLVRQLKQRDAVLDGAAVAADNVVEVARDLPRVARNFGHALLVVVEFFQRHDRQEDIVLLKAVDAGRVVQQDVGVENKKLG